MHKDNDIAEQPMATATELDKNKEAEAVELNSEYQSAQERSTNMLNEDNTQEAEVLIADTESADSAAIIQKSPSKFRRFLNKLNAFKSAIQKRPWLVLVILSAILLLLLALYLFYGMMGDVSSYRETGDEFYLDLIGFSLRQRYPTILAIVVVSICVGYSTVVFQTVTGARILTPGVLGFENVYMFLQTLLVLLFTGGGAVYILEGTGNYILSVVLMVGMSLLIFLPLLTKGAKGVFVLLLLGIILSTLFASLTSYIMLLIDPNEFDIIQGRMFASFTNPNMQVMLGAVILGAVALCATPSAKKLDVLSLGRENAIGLGVNYKFVVLRVLIIVSVLVAVSTVLVGPIMFLGLIAANLAYQIIKTFRHKYTIPTAILVAGIFLALGQFLIYHVITVQIQLPVVINLVGGVYFIFLLLRDRKKGK